MSSNVSSQGSSHVSKGGAPGSFSRGEWKKANYECDKDSPYLSIGQKGPFSSPTCSLQSFDVNKVHAKSLLILSTSNGRISRGERRRDL